MWLSQPKGVSTHLKNILLLSKAIQKYRRFLHTRFYVSTVRKIIRLQKKTQSSTGMSYGRAFKMHIQTPTSCLTWHYLLAQLDLESLTLGLSAHTISFCWTGHGISISVQYKMGYAMTLWVLNDIQKSSPVVSRQFLSSTGSGSLYYISITLSLWPRRVYNRLLMS